MLSVFLAFLLAVSTVGNEQGGDGVPNDEWIPATFSSSRVVGDILPVGADQPFQRLIDTTTGAGLFTTNSDPTVVGIDPLTGDAPLLAEVATHA